MEQSQQWSDYWQKEGAGAEVFVDNEGNKSSQLESYWKQKLADLNLRAETKIIDIASGAGSVFSNLSENHQFELYAQDISEKALDIQHDRIEGITPILSSAENIPCENEFFDLVVSQFGIEYAGIEAFVEAARILKVNGQLIFLSHYENGYIDSQNQLQLEGVELIEQLDFINKCINLTHLVYDKNPQNPEQVMDEFTNAEPVLEKYTHKNPKGVHCHLYQGFRKLFSNRSSYLEKDLIDWLNGMKEEVINTKARLTEMRKAAISEKKLANIVEQLKKSNIADIAFEPMSLKNTDKPLAWIISGKKKG